MQNYITQADRWVPKHPTYSTDSISHFVLFMGITIMRGSTLLTPCGWEDVKGHFRWRSRVYITDYIKIFTQGLWGCFHPWMFHMDYILNMIIMWSEFPVFFHVHMKGPLLSILSYMTGHYGGLYFTLEYFIWIIFSTWSSCDLNFQYFFMFTWKDLCFLYYRTWLVHYGGLYFTLEYFIWIVFSTWSSCDLNFQYFFMFTWKDLYFLYLLYMTSPLWWAVFHPWIFHMDYILNMIIMWSEFPVFFHVHMKGPMLSIFVVHDWSIMVGCIL